MPTEIQERWGLKILLTQDFKLQAFQTAQPMVIWTMTETLT